MRGIRSKKVERKKEKTQVKRERERKNSGEERERTEKIGRLK